MVYQNETFTFKIGSNNTLFEKLQAYKHIQYQCSRIWRWIKRRSKQKKRKKKKEKKNVSQTDIDHLNL